VNDFRRSLFIWFVWGLIVLLSAIAVKAYASVPEADKIDIPQASYLYRFKLEREVALRFGDTTPVARLAAQVHTESLWRANARSPYAQGLSQFTPSTATWLVRSVCPEIGAADPWDPNWSMRAMACYDHWLHHQLAGAATECDRWAFTFSAYNGGLQWLNWDRARTAAYTKLDHNRWFDNVELHSGRAAWARIENRNYVQNILRKVEPIYLTAGWPGQAVCS